MKSRDEQMIEWVIVIDGIAWSSDLSKPTFFSTKDDANKVIDHWLTSKTSWAHNVTTKEIVKERSKKGKTIKEVEVLYIYEPRKLEAMSFSEYEKMRKELETERSAGRI